MQIHRAKEKFCPRCEADVSDSYDPPNRARGVMIGTWFCDNCELGIPDEESMLEDDDTTT